MHHLRLLFYFICLGLGPLTVQAQLIYATTSGVPSELVLIDLSNGCSVTTIGPLNFNGNPISATDMAVCPDGTIYVTDSGLLWTVDPATAQMSLVGNMGPVLINSLACSDAGLLYGSSTILYEIDPLTGNATSLGALPIGTAGDITFYNGNLYFSSLAQIYQIDLSNPGNSQALFFVSQSFWGLSGYYLGCNAILGGSPGGNLAILDLDNQSETSLCFAGTSITGMGSADDFLPPPPCTESEIDLDDDDSSGATDADFNTAAVSCGTNEVLIADVDASIVADGQILTMNLGLGGVLDPPFESLNLAMANNITITGSGTTNLTLTNNGSATAADFLAALQAITYLHAGNPQTPGFRTVSVSFTTTNGTSNLAMANIQVLPNTLSLELGPTQFICPGESVLLDAGNPGAMYQWSTGQSSQSITVDQSGLYSVTVTDANGCTAMDEVLVSDLPVVTVGLSGNPTVCPGEMATLFITVSGPSGPIDVVIANTTDGSVIPVPGAVNGTPVFVTPLIQTTYFIQSLSEPTGLFCPEIGDDITIQVLQQFFDSQELAICQGESVMLEGAPQTEPGVYTDVYQASNGCDSTVITNLIVNPVYSNTIQTQTCDPGQAGTDTDLLTTVNGCDSIVVTVTTLVVNPPTLIVQSTCDPMNAGLDTLFLTDQFGCDSLTIIDNMLLPSDTTELEATTCDPTNAGTFTDLLTNSFGCDSLVITTIDLVAADTTSLSEMTCDPGQTGVFTELLIGSSGCDSVVITTVSLLPSDTTEVQATTCDPASAGTFTDLLTNSFGCDSLVITTIDLVAADTTSLSEMTCDPGQTGVFTELLIGSSGCDSVVITTVSLLPSDTTEVQATTCDPASAGTFTDLLTNSFGCDSLVITTIDLVAADTTSLSEMTCDPGQTGVFTELLIGSSGCDSVVITTVSLLPSDTTEVQATTCDPGNAGTFTDLLANSFGCDSLVITTIDLVAADTTSLSEMTCDPGQTGVFTELLIGSSGCDSVVITTVALLPSDTSQVIMETCDPDSIGVVEEVFSNQFGCDSLVIMETILADPADCALSVISGVQDVDCLGGLGVLELEVTIGVGPFQINWENTTTGEMGMVIAPEEGEPVLIEDLSAGSYTVIIEATNGLQETLILEIATTGLVETFESLSICSGDSILIFGNYETAPGLFEEIYSLSNGCDSVHQVELAVSSLPQLSFSMVSACFGQADGLLEAEATGGTGPYQFNWDHTIDTSPLQEGLAPGVYPVTVIDGNGCTNSGAFEVLELPFPDFTVVSEDVPCDSTTGGAILVNTSDPGLLFSLAEAGPFSGQASYTDLPIGTYPVYVQDETGCIFSETVLINSPIVGTVGLDSLYFIESGASVSLEPFGQLFNAETYFWEPAVGLSCTDCPEPAASPTTDTDYTLTVTFPGGCIRTTQTRVVVRPDTDIYFPNVFSPDFDGFNDNFKPFSDKDYQVISFMIFDRWGDAVYEELGQTLQSMKGWDGRARGKQMDPAVFVYFCELILEDGTILVFKGDVFLVR